MGFISIFSRSLSLSERCEPENLSPLESRPKKFTPADLSLWDDELDSSLTSNPFDFLDKRVGSSVARASNGQPAVSASVDADELLGTLYACYCEALQSPNALCAVEARKFLVPAAFGEEALTSAADTNPSSDCALSTMLAEPQLLEEAIGPLDSNNEFMLAMPDIAGVSADADSEVLALFDPREDHAGARGRKTTRPPPLVRREHHTLAIDSPMHVFGEEFAQ